MKRKEFLNRLLKISQLHESLNPIHDIALISTKTQSKEIPEPKITRFIPIESANSYWQQTSIKSREIVIIKNEMITSKVLIHAKGSNNSCRKIPSRRRMKTTPNHTKINSTHAEDLSKLLEDNCKSDFDQSQQKKQYFGSNFNIPDSMPHYLQIKQLQPKAYPRKVNQSKPLKQAVHEIQRYSRMKKHSLTEPTENYNKQSHTERNIKLQFNKIEVNSQNNRQIRSDSFKKYRSMGEHSSYHQKMEHNKLKISVRKEINKNYTKHFVPPPKLTAKAYIIYEVKEKRDESKVTVSSNSKNSQQVASLTKIMTCILSLQICQQFLINKATQQITIGKMESNVGGTTASLAHGEIYTVDQLLLGLMLPSGNDASLALAIWGGRKLLQREQQNKIINVELKTNVRFTKIECYNRFIIQMNTKAKEIGMNKTNYANSHGLMNQNNKSCAYDIAILCDYAMRNELFRTIVKCKHYKGVIRFNQQSKKIEDRIYRTENQDGRTTDLFQNEQKSPKRQASLIPNNRITTEKNISVQWQNTHKLLHLKPKEYLGIKTGYTVAAGPCLSSYLSINGRIFIIIVLGCGRVNLRFKETQILRKWLVKHESLKKKRVKTTDYKLINDQLMNDQQQELEEQEVEFLLQNMKIDEEKQD